MLTTDFGTTQFNNAAYISGTQFNDILKGNDYHNVFYGRDGFDTFIGNGAGNRYIALDGSLDHKITIMEM